MSVTLTAIPSSLGRPSDDLSLSATGCWPLAPKSQAEKAGNMELPPHERQGMMGAVFVGGPGQRRLGVAKSRFSVSSCLLVGTFAYNILGHMPGLLARVLLMMLSRA